MQFSAGVNLNYVMEFAKEKNWKAIEKFIYGFNSYLFELEAGPNKKIIGCQITVSANSAIMWKKLDSASSGYGHSICV